MDAEETLSLIPFTRPRSGNRRETVMKKRNVVGTVVVGTLLCLAPFSMDWRSASTLPPSLTLSSAAAAELAVPTRRGGYRHVSYYRSRSYDLYCGGPYVGSGWNGGTYWGGPWMELSCYGRSVEPVAYGEPVVRVKG